MIGQHWLSRRFWEADIPFAWIMKYVDRLEEQEKIQDEANPDENDDGEAITDRQSPPNVAIETPSIQAQISTAAEWCKQNADIKVDSTYYERLGFTYLSQDETELALQHLLEATNLPNCSWRVFQGLALLYKQKNQIENACQYSEICVAHLREKNEMDREERNEFATNLIRAARIHVDLDNSAKAIENLQEAIQVDEHFYQSYYELFRLYNDSGQVSDASRLLNGMMNKSAEKPELTQLEAMLLEYTKWMVEIESFEMFLQACKNVNMLEIHFQASQKALMYAENNKMQDDLINLLFAHGVALARYSTNEDTLNLALSRWEQCCDLVFSGGNHVGESTALSAARYLFNFSFTQIRTLQRGDREYMVHLGKMKDLARKARLSYNLGKPLNYSLAAVYSRSGDQDKSHALLMDEMKAGFALLWDGDSDNDDDGYKKIAYVLTHIGDDLDAISAWSLIGPPERLKVTESTPLTNDDEVKSIDGAIFSGTESLTGDHKQERPFYFYCDGRCSKTLSWSDGLWFCKICDDVQFNDECLEKLRKGTLPRLVCSSDHEWFYVPPWTDEYRATGKDRVRMGGELKDG